MAGNVIVPNNTWDQGHFLPCNMQKTLREVRIVGLGKHLPGEPLTNAELVDICNLTDDKWTPERCLKWTEEKIGIQTRHVSRDKVDVPAQQIEPGCENSSLCAHAIENAINNSGYPKSDIGLFLFYFTWYSLFLPFIRSYYNCYCYSRLPSTRNSSISSGKVRYQGMWCYGYQVSSQVL